MVQSAGTVRGGIDEYKCTTKRCKRFADRTLYQIQNTVERLTRYVWQTVYVVWGRCGKPRLVDDRVEAVQ